jgi:hypothetical protein
MCHRLRASAAAVGTFFAFGLLAPAARAQGEEPVIDPAATAAEVEGEKEPDKEPGKEPDKEPEKEKEPKEGKEPKEEKEAEEEHGPSHPKLRIGGFGVLLNASIFGERQETENLAGGGLAFKYELHERVILGIVPHIVGAPQSGNFEVPIDLLLEFPIHLSHNIHPYYGLGPGFSVLFAKDTPLGDLQKKYFFRLVLAAGVDFWVTNRISMFIEVNVNNLATLSIDHPEYTLQLGSSSGLLVGF